MMWDAVSTSDWGTLRSNPKVKMGLQNVCRSLKSCGRISFGDQLATHLMISITVFLESQGCSQSDDREALLVLRKYHLRLPVGWALSLLTTWDDDASRAAKPDLTCPE